MDKDTNQIPEGYRLIVGNIDEISARELHDVLLLRQSVFIEEQNVSEVDLDGLDANPETIHFILVNEKEDYQISSYLRVLPSGLPNAGGLNLGARRISRVVSNPKNRGQGLSSVLLQAAVNKMGDEHLSMHAQSHLIDFYKRFGFRVIGDEFEISSNFVEAGILHTPMRRPANGEADPELDA